MEVTKEKTEKSKELNVIAKKILFYLDQDATQTLKQIGKKIKKSPQYVNYWIERLIEEGYIKKFITVINYKKLGYCYYSIYIAFRIMKPEDEQKFIEYLASDNTNTILYSCHGDWDVVVGTIAKDPVDIYTKILDIKKEFPEAIGNLIVETHVGSKYYGRRYLGEETEISLKRITPITGEKTEIEGIDEKDIKILSAIKDNARISMMDLAEKTGLSPDIVRYRIKKLRDKGFILSASILPDYTRVSLRFYRLLLKTKGSDAAREEKLIRFFSESPYVLRINKEFGTYDLSVDIEVPERSLFREMIRSMKSYFYDIIAEWSYIHIIDAYKSYYFL
jgi:Lrp/AsnC family leucine-responsive transcriptional regulator